MDFDRDRERDPAMDIAAQYKAQQEKLWLVQALDPKVRRTLTFEEKAAFQRLRDAYKDEEDWPYNLFTPSCCSAPLSLLRQGI
jgi:hypothetical protein